MSLLLRKLEYLRGQSRRALQSRALCLESVPIVANSFPKSGTHLLTQILEGQPGVKNYLTFLASLPSWKYVERSEMATLRKIQGFVGGEMVSAHLFYRPEYAAALRKKAAIHFFIYRDPRDVASEAHYLSRMARFHRLHGTFRRLADEKEQLSLSILGDAHRACPVPYGNIAQRFRMYQGWLTDPDVCALRFEDLVGPEQPAEVARICRFFLERQSKVEATEGQLVEQALKAINPERSHTYRPGGGVRNWEKRFTPQHKAQFKEVAGDLLIELGYESDLDW